MANITPLLMLEFLTITWPIRDACESIFSTLCPFFTNSLNERISLFFNKDFFLNLIDFIFPTFGNKYL